MRGHLGKEARAGAEAQRSRTGTKAVEAAAVDGARRPHLRPDRLRRVAEDWLRAGRNSLHWHKASGDIVLVKIDDASLREVGRWPWPRRYHAQLIDRLTEAGAKRIFFDIDFSDATDPADDQALRRRLEAVRARRACGAHACRPERRRAAGRKAAAGLLASRQGRHHQRGSTISRTPCWSLPIPMNRRTDRSLVRRRCWPDRAGRAG